MISIGDKAPGFDLPDTEGERHALGNGGAPTVVVFTCNHCPYALAWHDRILDVARDYAGRGVRVLAINSNDAERYPRDSYEAMQERVRKRGLAAAVPARRQPGRRARLRRADDPGRVRVRRRRQRCATAARPTRTTTTRRRTRPGCAARSTRARGPRPDPAETKPVGCSVKWKA